MSAQDEIVGTLHRAARGFDDDDIDLLMDCFTSDAELVSYEGTTSGGDAIRAALTARRAAHAAEGGRPRHLVTNIEVALESDVAASSRAAYVLFSARAAGIAIVSTGVYADRLRNEGGTWRIGRRHVQVDREG